MAVVARPELTFDPGAHRYFLDGAPVPSVTTVLDRFLFDPSGIPEGTLEAKRILGGRVHKAVHYHLDGDLDEDSLTPDVRGYFAGWRKFESEHGYRPILTERQVAHTRYRYAGTLDGYGSMEGCDRAMIDLKCTYALSPSTMPQTAAYAEALTDSLGHKIDGRFGLQLKPDGTYHLADYDEVLKPRKSPGAKDFRARDFAIFLNALALFNWCRRHKLERT